MMADDAIDWIGNPDDDCHSYLGLFRAHSECLDGHNWYCHVWYEHPATGKPKSVFHSGDYPALILTDARKSRKLAEAVMRACHAAAGLLLDSSRIGAKAGGLRTGSRSASARPE